MPGPTDTVMSVINAANVRLNGRVETLQAIGGQILGNTDAYSNRAVNDAWRKLQNGLADKRYAGLQDEIVLSNVPAAGAPDPTGQCYLDYGGFSNCGTYTTGGSILLPAQLLRPYYLTERAHSATTALFTEMDEHSFALPHDVKSAWNRRWLWRNSRLYIPGATVATDIIILFGQLLADFVDISTPSPLAWFQQSIPLPNVLDAFADYVCREIEAARGEAGAASAWQLSAEANVDLMLNQDTAAAKSIIKPSEYGKMRDRFTPKSGADMERVDRGA